jgi:hypothetical protein
MEPQVWFLSGSPKKFSGSRSGSHTQFEFQVTWSEIWLIIPISDFFLPKNLFLKILVLVQVLGTGEGHWAVHTGCGKYCYGAAIGQALTLFSQVHFSTVSCHSKTIETWLNWSLAHTLTPSLEPVLQNHVHTSVGWFFPFMRNLEFQF